MKPHCHLILFIGGSLLGGAGTGAAQVFTTLHSFSGGDSPTSLILSGNTLYGTTSETVFKVKTDGSGFSTLHTFTDGNTNSSGIFTNYDGVNPSGSLVLSNNTLYGTTYSGGTSGNGTVFKLNTDGTGFTTLYSFSASSTNLSGSYTNCDGVEPSGGLALLGNTLYGSAQRGGSSGNGTLFKLNTDGAGFTVLHDFTALIPYYTSLTGYLLTNSDGAWPFGLVVAGNAIYGTASGGGSSAEGTVFAVNTDGTGFKPLLASGSASGLILSGNSLYGTVQFYSGGSVDAWVFKYNSDSTTFTHLYSDYFGNGSSVPGATEEFSWGPLVLSGDTLYCTMWHRDPPLFLRDRPTTGSRLLAIKTDGTGYATPYGCCGACGGLGPPEMSVSCVGFSGSLALSHDILYGIMYRFNELYGPATISSLSFAPQLSTTLSGPNVILSWPTNYPGFDYSGYILQTTTNLDSSTIWITNLLAPLVVNGQYTVTNPASGPQRFYRLVR
jgi:uncharacterized repeat protein (TIGR03803 family)